MRSILHACLVLALGAAFSCKNSEFKGTGSYAGGNNRNSGDSSKEDLLNNSAFDDGEDGDELGGKEDGGKDQADLDGDVNDANDAGNANAPDSMVDIIRLCSNRYTEAAGTNLKASSTGAVVSLHPTPDNTNGKAVHFHSEQNAAQIRKDVMNYGKFKLPLQKVRGGAYTLMICDAASAATCKATPAVVEAPTQFVSPKGGRPITSFGTGVRFGAAKGVLGSGIVQVKDGKLVNVTGSFLPAGKAQLIEVLTDKNLEDTAMQQSFFNMFASMSGTAQPFQPLSQTDLESIQDCDESASPLIVDLDNKGLKLAEPFPGVAFDIDANGTVDHISWPKAKDDMFVVLDVNGNGTIDSGAELFGNNSIGPDAQKAANGFLALAKYDDNKDKLIDAKDEIYAKLRLWSDDGDGVSQAGELLTLDSQGVESIDLAYKDGMQKDAFANQTRQRSVVRLKSGLYRMIVDLWFRVL